jgi:hypothetical protein
VTPAAVPAPPKPKPKPKACYRLTLSELARPANGSTPVSCRRRHDAVTIYVGRLHTVVNGHALSVDSTRVQRQLSTACPREFANLIGGSPATRNLSRFKVVWFSPTLAQSDLGANWFRCDLIAFARQNTLMGLPPLRRLEGALSRPGSLGTYGLCGTAAPGDPHFARVICAKPHSWRAISTIAIPGGKHYPGAAAVRRAGDAACQRRVRSRSGFALQFRYGWEWPTREQWAVGQHYGYCWAPA